MVLKTRFPESRYPGKFDLWGSHSIFHILVVCAAVVQLMGYLDAFNYAQANLTCSSPWVMKAYWVWSIWSVGRASKRWLSDSEEKHMIWPLLAMADSYCNCLYPMASSVKGHGTCSPSGWFFQYFKPEIDEKICSLKLQSGFPDCRTAPEVQIISRSLW